MCIAAFCTIVKLYDIQILDEKEHSKIAAEELIEREELPAQRGIIMDRNEEILTNNIQRSELIADRYHLREITVVLKGLIYNQVINDPLWKNADEGERREIKNKHRNRLFSAVRSKLKAEEKNALREELGLTRASDIRKLNYDREVCEYFYQLHDGLVADIIYPILRNKKITDNLTGESRRIERNDLLELISQPEIKAYNDAAKANGTKRRNYRSRIVLAKNLTQGETEQIKEALKMAGVSGIYSVSHTLRSYVNPTLLSHVIGYVNYENKGLAGIEGRFNNHLSGIKGMREYRRNPRGQILPHEDDRYQAAKHGLNLKLTIDMRIQNIVEEELDKGLRRFNAPRGCVIVIEPKTGDILAMVSRPSMDINSKEVITPLQRLPRNNKAGRNGKRISADSNFATQARYEPGSTFKVVAAGAGIDTGTFHVEQIINCEAFRVKGDGGRAITDRPFNYHQLPLWAVLKKSSNPGIARIALATRWEKYEKYIDALGLKSNTGICLESGGGCSIQDGSNLLNFSRISFGYSISVSPLHVAMIYATLANNGLRMKPRLVDAIITEDGEIFDDCPPVAMQQVFKPQTVKDILKGLESVTTVDKKYRNGTAMRAAIPGFRIGGKTGTAKKTSSTGAYQESVYTVSFAGIFPVDKPKYVIMTVVDEPKPTDRNSGGGTICAPIFREIALRLIETFHMTPSDPVAYDEFRIKHATKQAEILAESNAKILPQIKQKQP